MKKLYFIAALAAIGLASCTSEEVVTAPQTPQEITFNAVTQKATRSALIGSKLPKETPIFVSAFHEGDDNVNNPFHEYFKNKRFEQMGGDPENQYYGATQSATYPIQGDVEFIAYTATNFSVLREEGQTTSYSGYVRTIELPDAKVTVEPKATASTTSREDRYINKLTLDFGENLDGQTDVIYSKLLRVSNLENGIPTKERTLTMNHALAWVKVNFQYDDTDNRQVNDDFLIKDVEIIGADLSGTVCIEITKDNGEYQYKVKTPVVASTPASTIFPEYGTNINTLSGAATAKLNGILVLPQAQKEIKFKYCKKQENVTFDPTHPEELTGYNAWKSVTIPIATDSNGDAELWKAGTSYQYNVTFAPGMPIKFSCDVTGWEGPTKPVSVEDTQDNSAAH